MISKLAKSADRISPSSINAHKTGNKELPESTVKCIQNLFLLDSISRQAPGRKDYVSVRSEGKKMKWQKCHMVWSLKEVYKLFRSKFCSLTPVHVLLSSFMHRDMCLCQCHANIRMLYECIAKEVTTLPPYSEALVDNFVCDSKNEICMTGKCTRCPNKCLL